MENDILNLETACEFLGVSDRTLIKLLREEHLPARKIGREWRFSRRALLEWLSAGDSYDYSNQTEENLVFYQDRQGDCPRLLDAIREDAALLKKSGDLKGILGDLENSVSMPGEMTLRTSYKRRRGVESFSFKLFWPTR